MTVVVIAVAVMKVRKWWRERRRGRREGLEEDGIYLEAMGEEMKRQIKEERMEKREKAKENIYEEI